MLKPSDIRNVAFLGDYLPRKCGIATFTTDRVSQNEGAESTLAFLLALAEKQALQNTLASFKEPAGK